MSNPFLTTQGLTPSETSVIEALERVYESGQRLIVRRLDLMMEQVRVLLRYAGLAVAGCVLGLWGWSVAMGGVIEGLSPYAPRFAVAMVIGALHVAAGVAILWRVRQSWKRLEDLA